MSWRTIDHQFTGNLHRGVTLLEGSLFRPGFDVVNELLDALLIPPELASAEIPQFVTAWINSGYDEEAISRGIVAHVNDAQLSAASSMA